MDPLYLFLLFPMLSDMQISWDETISKVERNPCEYREHIMCSRLGFLQNAEDLFLQELMDMEGGFHIDEAKYVLCLPSFVLKKRYLENQYHERLAWEIGEILHLDRYMVPSYLVFSNEQGYTVQLREDFHVSPALLDLPDIYTKMSLKDYWLGNFLIYLLGSWDLTSANIGYHSRDFHPIYFDLEHSFSENNEFIFSLDLSKEDRLKYQVGATFIPRNLCGKLFYQKLTSFDVAKLENYQRLMRSVCFPKIVKYLEENKELQEGQKRAFLERMENLLTASFTEGMSFKDFLIYLFPVLPTNYMVFFEKISSVLQWGDLGFGGVMFWLSNLEEHWRRGTEDYEKINDELDRLNGEKILKSICTEEFLNRSK